jgi:hypothetical protein
VSILVWSMVGIAMWHFTVFVRDRFWGGIIGAFLAALGGALLTGYLLPTPGIPTANPPCIEAGLYAFPGSVLGLVASYFYGVRPERRKRSGRLTSGAHQPLPPRRATATGQPAPLTRRSVTLQPTRLRRAACGRTPTTATRGRCAAHAASRLGPVGPPRSSAATAGG